MLVCYFEAIKALPGLSPLENFFASTLGNVIYISLLVLPVTILASLFGFPALMGWFSQCPLVATALLRVSLAITLLMLSLLSRASPRPMPRVVLYGSFETSDFSNWTRGGELGQNVSTISYNGSYAAQLGTPVSCGPQPPGSAWMYQTVTLPTEMHSPTLSFWYRIITNDILDWASFRVEIRDSHNVTLAQVLRDGYEPPDNIAICHNDLEWRSYSYDLSEFKGQIVRLWFESRNEHDGALGIWACVDNVKVLYAP